MSARRRPLACSRCRIRFAGLLLLALAVLLTEAPSAARPQYVVVLFDGLTADALANPRIPALQSLAKSGAIGLMNTAVAGPRTDTAATLVLAMGALAPAEPTDEDAFQLDEPVERGTAAVVYRRRTGNAPPSAAPGAIVHLGIASLQRRAIAESLPGSILVRAGKHHAIAVCGNADTDAPGRRVALFGIDARGIASGRVSRACLLPAPDLPYGVRDDAPGLAKWAADQSAQVVFIYLGDGARAEAAQPRLGRSAYLRARAAALAGLDTLVGSLQRLLPSDRTRVLVLSPRPPSGRGGQWDRLTLAVLAGPGIRRGVLTSATTRTRALVANIDLGPTILAWLGVRPPAALGGHPLQVQASDDPTGEARRLDVRATLNEHALTPVFLLLGVLTLLCVFGGLAACLRRSSRSARAFAFAVLTLINMPLAMMLAVLVSVTTVPALAAAVLALMVCCAALETWIARLLRRQAALLSAAAVLLAIAVDGCVGQPLIKFSMLSAYQISGIRFHGIGNEYMGVIIGCTLLVAFMGRLGRRSAAALFAACALILSLPWFGDKAGGIVVAAVSFGSADAILRGRRVGWKTALAWTVVGFAGAFALAGLDRLISGGQASHMGGALGAAGQRGWSYLWWIAVRKIGMNLRLMAHPYTLCALCAVGAFLFLARRGLGRRVEELTQAHPGWAHGIPAAGWGALAALLFNDSGIIAALFLGGSFLITGIYFLLADPPRTGAAQDSTAPTGPFGLAHGH